MGVGPPNELAHLPPDHGVHLGGDPGEDGRRRAHALGEPEAEGAVESRLEAGNSELVRVGHVDRKISSRTPLNFQCNASLPGLLHFVIGP